MANRNLALLSDSKRAEIELSKRAAFLVYQLKHGKTSRFDVENEIDKTADENKERFREMINQFRSMKL